MNKIFSVQIDCLASLMSSCIFVFEKCVCLVILSALPKIVNNGFFGFWVFSGSKDLKKFTQTLRASKQNTGIHWKLKQTNILESFEVTKKDLVTKFLKSSVKEKNADLCLMSWRTSPCYLLEPQRHPLFEHTQLPKYKQLKRNLSQIQGLTVSHLRGLCFH